ncbi:MAG: L,D-transpeptidase [Maritimibacter sp.]|nr:L,D-transpeptidase [Maritimibacter sp.]
MNIVMKAIAPALAGVAVLATGAQATERLSTSGRSDQIVIRIDKSDQEMTVMQGSRRLFNWPVSTGAWGYDTPVGTYQPTWFSPNHRSRQYGGAPMPWAIFFHQGYAIHATFDTYALGSRASHGCIRLEVGNAEELYQTVFATGKEDTYIVIQE